MNDTQSQLAPSVNAHYADLYEQLVSETAFLWTLRGVSLQQPHYTVEDIAKLEQRIDAALDALMTAADLAWKSCTEALTLAQPGEQFTAAVIALRSDDVRAIQVVVETGLTNKRATEGLISALGWLKSEIATPWIGKFLQSKDLNHKYLGVAACSIRRQDPGELLGAILARDDCRQHPELYARALRLVGELRRRDLITAVHAAAQSSEPAIAFWAHWSHVLLGQPGAANNLLPLACRRGPFQARALALVFRALPLAQARAGIATLAKDPTLMRAAIAAAGILGDPQAIDWLIAKMADPQLAKLAAESFTHITGIELAPHALDLPEHRIPVASEDFIDPATGLDADENLPWPDADKIAAFWQNRRAHFQAGQRYFRGKPVTAAGLKQAIAASPMRTRHAGALEWVLLDPAARLVNTHAKLMP